MTEPLAPPPPAVQQQPPPAGGQPLASWGSRAVALIIDSLLIAIPLALAITFAVVAALREDDGEPAGLYWALFGLLLLVYFVLPFLYFPILNGNERGQTIGKRIMGIRVRRMDGSPLGVGRGLGRYALVFAAGLVAGPLVLLDYLWPLWDERHQALHDKAVDSVVVRA